MDPFRLESTVHSTVSGVVRGNIWGLGTHCTPAIGINSYTGGTGSPELRTDQTQLGSCIGRVFLLMALQRTIGEKRDFPLFYHRYSFLL